LKLYHPTSVLETGYDILFFWVARMILMSTYLLGEVPFKTVYLHGLVRDEQGRKMSKSLGNIINPLDMIEKYGADATRLSLVLGNTPGNDLKLSEEKIAGFRNFTNKLWNISRFILSKMDKVASVEKVEPKTLADRWILGRFSEVVEKVTKLQESYDLSLAGEILRDFTWSEFADWYLEIAKIEGEKDDILLYILERLLILWHPFMPFVTEEIYKSFDKGLIMVAKWPKDVHFKLSEEERKHFSNIQEIVTAIRNVRAQYKIAPKQAIEANLIGGAAFEQDFAIIAELTKLCCIMADQTDKREAVTVAAGGVTIWMPISAVIDVPKERARLTKELESTEKYVKSVEAKLGNAEFVKNAPAEVIEKEKGKLEEAKKKLEALKEQYASI
jgi:valyl-tRNA synthetase